MTRLPTHIWSEWKEKGEKNYTNAYFSSGCVDNFIKNAQVKIFQFLARFTLVF